MAKKIDSWKYFIAAYAYFHSSMIMVFFATAVNTITTYIALGLSLVAWTYLFYQAAKSTKIESGRDE